MRIHLKILTVISILLFHSFSSFGQNISDTLTVDTNSIIFYSITNTELDTLSHNDSDRGLNETLSDFEYYVGKLNPILKKDTSKYVLYTAHRFFRIVNGNGTTIFDRVEPKNAVGMILNGITEYKISRGVGTDVDMMQTIYQFFGEEYQRN